MSLQDLTTTLLNHIYKLSYWENGAMQVNVKLLNMLHALLDS